MARQLVLRMRVEREDLLWTEIHFESKTPERKHLAIMVRANKASKGQIKQYVFPVLIHIAKGIKLL